MSAGQVDVAAQELGTTSDRLLQQIELFIETVSPGVVIFIDDTNQDLADFAHALNLSIQVFRVKKLLTDGKPGYYSPDHKPIVETEHDKAGDSGDRTLAVLEQLGGGRLLEGTGRFKCYCLEDGRIIRIHYSKLHQRQNYYWYGIAPSQVEQMKENDVSHVVFILGDAGFVMPPVDKVLDFVKNTRTTDNSDGTVRHYHVLISREPEPEMYWSSDTPSFSLADSFETFR